MNNTIEESDNKVIVDDLIELKVNDSDKDLNRESTTS